MNANTSPSLTASSNVTPRRWEWYTPGESGAELLSSVEVKDGKLLWCIEPDHDGRRGSQDDEQTYTDFLAYGPEHISPPEQIAREVAAHLGLTNPSWLQPLDPQIKQFLRLALKGDVAGLEQMLAAGMDINVTDHQGYSALWNAVSWKREEAIQALLAAGADVQRLYRRKKTLLMLAAERGNLPLLQHLLACGVEVNARDENGDNALLYSITYVDSPLNIFQALAEAGADSLNEAFVKAARSGATDIVRYLVGQGQDVNARARDGWTPFLASLWGGFRPELAEELLAAGGDPRIPFPHGSTVLHSVAGFGYRWMNILQTALRAGVDVNARDAEGQTALMRAVSNYDSVQYVRALVGAGADVNARDFQGETALCRASYDIRPECIKALVEAGADPNLPCKDGQSVLFRLLSGDIELIELLLRAGADSNAPQPSNHTALHKAARSGQIAGIKLLLQYGAYVNAREEVTGRTPLWYAYSGNKRAVFDVLAEAGGELEGDD